MAELRAFQPLFHVPQHILVGYKIDEMRLGVGGKLAEFLGGDGRFIAEKIAVLRIIEAEPFHVKLQMVDAHFAKQPNQTVQRFHLGDLVAANVQHDAADFQRGGVLHGADGQIAAGGLYGQLADGLDGVVQTRAIGAADVYAVLTDFHLKRAGDAVHQIGGDG